MTIHDFQLPVSGVPQKLKSHFHPLKLVLKYIISDYICYRPKWNYSSLNPNYSCIDLQHTHASNQHSWNFWTCIHHYKFGPPEKVFRDCGLAFILFALLKCITHVETENSSIVQLLVQWRKPAHRQKRKRSPNTDWIEIVWEDRPVLDAETGLRESVLVNRLLLCMILLKVQTQTRPVLSGCEMTCFCYMTRSINHYVHDHDFGTPWLLYVNREQLHFFCCIMTTFY